MAAALLGALVTAWVVRPAAAPSSAGSLPRATELPRTITQPDTRSSQPARPALPTTARPKPAPTLVLIPRLGIRMPVLAGGVDRDGAMALPDTPFEVSWYRFGPAPLDRQGVTVIAGHVDTRDEGTGPLARLASLGRGDEVTVRAGRRDVDYRVVSVTRISKAVLDLPAIFSRVGPPRLHLITCGGAYLPDQGGYQDNVIVAARRVAS